MNYFDSNKCDKSFHSFARDGENMIQAYHLNGDNYELCESAEFNLSDLLNDELPRAIECPGCDKETLNEDDHIRACIGFKKPYSESEIRDCYSDGTERTKRDSLLRDLS